MNQFNKGLLLLAVLTVTGCGGSSGGGGDTTPRDYSNVFIPLPSQIPFPEDNPYSAEKAALGELLFWDPILSGEQNVACATCHHPDFGWADGRDFSIGVDGVGLGPQRYGEKVTPIHSPTIANTAYTGASVGFEPETFTAGPYFWDLRADSLETQSLGPIQNEIEMLGDNIAVEQIFNTIEQRLQDNGEYQYLFEQAFPELQTITINHVAQALSTFQRTVNGGNTRFDQFMAGDTSVFTEQEIAGLNVFIDDGCVRCHSGPLLSDNLLHAEEPIIEDLPAVRTPSLRNISQTAPYMHDGSRQTLRDAIAIYEDRGDIDVSIGDGDFNELEAFLRTLDSDLLSRPIPESVPSGLPVGGDIH